MIFDFELIRLLWLFVVVAVGRNLVVTLAIAGLYATIDTDSAVRDERARLP